MLGRDEYHCIDEGEAIVLASTARYEKAVLEERDEIYSA